jgi:hypothetical protein
LDILTSKQVSEWLAYDRLDPIGEYRNDSRFAIVCSTITNIARSIWGKNGSKMTLISDFMPQYEQKQINRKPKQSVEQMKDILKTIAGVYGKKRSKK